MRTTGETGASEQEEVRAVERSGFLCSHPHLSTHGLGASVAASSPRNSAQHLLAFFSTWWRLDKGLQKDGGARRHSSGWHRDGGYHHRFGLQGWLPGGQGFA